MRKARPKALSPREQRDDIDREKAINAFPLGTYVGKDFVNKRGDARTFIGEVVGFRARSWQVKYGDGGWEGVRVRETGKLVEKGWKNKKSILKDEWKISRPTPTSNGALGSGGEVETFCRQRSSPF